MKRMSMVLSVVAAIVPAAWSVSCKGPAKPVADAAKSAPAPVMVAEVARKDVPLDLHTFGSVEAMASVALKSQITGLLTNAPFAEGQAVHEGDLLFVIDPRAQEAQLKSAEASRAKDIVQLRNAEKEAARQDQLFKSGISAEDVRDQARTAVDALQAAVQSDEAALDTARLQLDYCRIRAPVSGRIGSILVNVGNLIKADDVTLATINQVNPIMVHFSLPQQELGRVRVRMAANPITVMATLSGPTSCTKTGTLVFVDNAVDSTTGAVIMKARFDNTDEAFWHGQFVNVTLQLTVEKDTLVVPARAVLPGQKGISYVYRVEADSTVKACTVHVTRTAGDDAVITGEVGPGDRVVTDGQLRLAPGSRVVIKPAAVAIPVKP